MAKLTFLLTLTCFGILSLTISCDAESSPKSRIIELSDIISSATAQIQETLDSQGIAPFSFDGLFPDIPSSIVKAQIDVIDATAELNALLTDPFERIQDLLMNDEASILKIISSFGIAGFVPLDGQLSFSDIAKKTTLTEAWVTRILRHAIIIHIFYEPQPGFIAHTPASRLLVNPDMSTYIIAANTDYNPAIAKLTDALIKWDYGTSREHSGYALAIESSGKGFGYFDKIIADDTSAYRYKTVLDVQFSRPGFEAKYAIQGYDWKSLGKVLVIGIGGGMARLAQPLAKECPDMELLISDHSKLLVSRVDADVADRVHFANFGYDPVKGPIPGTVLVFAFRHFFNMFPDAETIFILQKELNGTQPGTEPGTEIHVKQPPGTKFIVQEQLRPEPGMGPRWIERQLIAKDIELGAVSNARLRTLDEWKAIFASAEPGFEFLGMTMSEGSALATLEFVWNG